MSTILRNKIVKTRKDHCCFGCARIFPAGSEMEFSVVKDDDIFNSYLCKTCLQIMNKMVYGDEFCFGDLSEEALEIEEGKN